MSGDGLRDTCCPDLWVNINELQAELEEAKAVIAKQRTEIMLLEREVEELK